MSASVWYIQEGEGSEYLDSILKFLLLEYERIFGVDTMNNEPCIVYNDPQSECPMLIINANFINANFIKIRLSQKSLSFWAQTIFQLSHELCHYAIRQSKVNKDFTLSWFEEIVCEAMSLYALHWSAEHWEDCALARLNPEFSNHIRTYLEKELKSMGTDGFRMCTSVEALRDYDAESDRESYRNERNQLYYEIAKDPLASRCFCDYSRYVDSNGITINFEEWEKDDPSPMVRFLHSLQPVKDNGSCKR